MFNKKIRPFVIPSFFISSVLVSSVFLVSAQSTTTTATSTAQQPTAQIVADVNLQDCTYTQATSTNQVIHISCNIINKLGNQGDIHYGVQLTKRGKNTQDIVDTKAYSQTLSLRANQTIKQEIDYTPPSYLSGEYELWGLLKTSDGLPLATNFLGKVNLKDTSVSYLEIKSDTCSLHIKGDTGTTTYNVRQVASVNSTEILEGSCTVVSHATSDITVTPSFATHRRSIFGEIVADTKDIQPSVTFKKNESKVISFTVPKVQTPQLYEAVLSLVSADVVAVSNDVVIHYILLGASATIQNVFLDKDYYLAGDTAIVSLFWTGSEGGDSNNTDGNKVKSVIISMKDDNNNSCAKEATFAVSSNERDRNALTFYPLPITSACVNPQVTIKIVDEAGTILTQKTIVLTSGNVPESATQNPRKKQIILYGLVALLVASLSVIVLFVRNINKTNEII